MSDAWNYIGPDGRVGPVSFDALRAELARRPHPAAVVVWKENAASWSLASDVPGLVRDPNVGAVGEAANATDPTHTATAAIRGAVEPEPRPAPGRLIGAAVILAGCGLIYLGVAGKLTWIAGAFGLRSEFVSASPGAALAVVGLVLVWRARTKA